jgi:hypothetical protein
LIVYQRSDIHYRGALPFPETQNRGLKIRKFDPELPEFCEIFNEKERKTNISETNNKNDIKVGKIQRISKERQFNVLPHWSRQFM